MARPKSADQAFTTAWNTAVAWAQSKGIPIDSVIPVYQLDSQRLTAGQYPMSAGERNRAILAANNPNDVTPAPSDNPRPSNVLGNAKRDLGMIATGLEPQHLFSGLFDTVKNTVEDVMHPSRLAGPNLGTTAANWLQDTALSLIPGLADVGTVLRADPNLSGDQGAMALAKDPLLSILDVLPFAGSKALMRATAGTRLGEAVAGKAGVTTAQYAESSPLKLMARMAGARPTTAVGMKADFTLGPLTVGERLQNWLGDSRLGTNKTIQQFVGEWVLGNQLSTEVYQNMMAPALDAWQVLEPEQKQAFDEVFYRHQRGESLDLLLGQVDSPTREAILKMVNGPLRYLTDEALASGDIVPVRSPDGRMAMFSSRQPSAVVNARDVLVPVRQSFLESLHAADRLRTSVEALDAQVPALADGLTQANQAAQESLRTDEGLLGNITEQYQAPGAKRPAPLFLGVKRDAAQAVIGGGGLVDKLIEALRTGKDDELEAMVPIVSRRMTAWGHHSIDATTNPAWAALKAQVDRLDRYLTVRQRLTDEIDNRIVGEHKATVADVKAHRETRQAQRQGQKDRHARERKQLTDQRKREMDQVRTAKRVNRQHSELWHAQKNELELTRADQAAARATPQQADAIYAQTKQAAYVRMLAKRESIRVENLRYDKMAAELGRRWDKTMRDLKDRHLAERKHLATQHAAERVFEGELTREMRDYASAVGKFHRSVYNHPSDEYRNLRLEIYMKHLMENHHSAELIDATERHHLEDAGMAQSAVDALTSDPQKLRELVAHTVDDIYNNPQNYDPELASAASEAKEEAIHSAIDEINTLIAEGHHPRWIPAAGPFDEPNSAIRAMVGHGVPHVDVAYARSHSLVATRHDAILGVTKGMHQALQRDTFIDFVQQSIMPRTLTGDQLEASLKQFLHFETDWNPNRETEASWLSRKTKEAGLIKVDPQALFGWTLPAWKDKALYMPENLATAVRRVNEVESKTGILAGPTKVFRYSILGLSPRYTAHILFGGTFLLALRSTPYMPMMLAKAARAMRNGEIPEAVFRQPTQEGFTRLRYALDQHGKASGQQLANLALQEHIGRVQKIALHKASPIHWVKAAADLNFRFTRATVRMQSAIAYLDYAAKAERRGAFVDEVTGETVAMTKERAMKEGMHHVEEVFGNLRSMSPLERQVARNLLPFYGWTRHIIKYVLSFPFDHPWRAMVLSEIAWHNSAEVPKGLPERIQFLFFLGQPDAQGNVNAVDLRFMDPLRDVANYATLGGWLQGLNPALLAPLAMLNPQAVYGSNALYPNLTYDALYGIEEAGPQGNIGTGLSQFIPQLGALQLAFDTASGYRKLAGTNSQAFYKTLMNDLGIPGLDTLAGGPVNVKQIAAHDETARYEVAKAAATNAWQSPNSGGTGLEQALAGYASVPNPAQPDYEITPAALQAVYNAAMVQYPGLPPAETITPPPPPPGF